MNWFWLNIPLGAVFFIAMAGIPFWMVITHPDRSPASAGATGKGTRAQTGNVAVAGIPDRPIGPAQICDQRELVGASARDLG